MVEYAPCPNADRIYQANFNNEDLQIPNTEDQVRDFLGNISSNKKEISDRAIVSLALSGNLEAFKKLLREGNDDGLFLYSSFYQNDNGTKCIDPILEKAVVEHLSTPKTGNALLQLFRKNLYQSRVLFEKLLHMELAVRDARELARFEFIVSAITANNIRGTAQDVLRHGLAYAAHIDRKLWWDVSGVDSLYVDFFTRQNFGPGIQYIQEILDENHFSEVSEIYKGSFINRQNVLYYKLGTFPSSKKVDVFIHQLSKLVDLPWDFYFNVELDNLGKLAIKHSQSISQRKQIVDLLTKIIKTGKRPGINVCAEDDKSQNNWNIRSTLIQLLAQAATDEAVAVLVQELKSFVEKKSCRNEIDFATHIVTTINELPESVSLNVPDFLRAALKIEGQQRYFAVPDILKKHIHPDGLKYLLLLLDEIIVKKAEPNPIFGTDFHFAFNSIFENLLAFDKPEYLFETRKKIDSLREDKKLEDEIYAFASERLNSLIGNESPIYLAFLKQKEEKEKERKMQPTR
ncbi:MAG: hypothetical protein Q8M34_07630 [Thermodesulfovibrionales bacterium]|nr:hypothetical protein [Thermodesulfovibrionales bacterium]